MSTPTATPTTPTPHTPRTTRWGVLATGSIARTVSGDIALAPGAELAAVASRDAGRAAAFAADLGFARSHGSYADLLADDGVDAVYVATPHAQHVALAVAAVEAGKAVLVEKPVACTAAATQRLADAGRAHGVFVMEAMWTRFQPLVVHLCELLAAGAVGQVRTVAGDLGFASPFDAGARLWDPAQGGGSLLDVGVYPVAFAQMVLGGAPATTAAVGQLAATGVDAEASVLLGWDDGRSARLGSTLLGHAGGTAVITGTAGRIEVAGPLHRPRELRVWTGDAQRDDDPQVVQRPYTGRGYVHMVEHVQACLADGLTESPVMPLADSLVVARVLDAAMDALGAVHVDDPTPLGSSAGQERDR